MSNLCFMVFMIMGMVIFVGVDVMIKLLLSDIMIGLIMIIMGFVGGLVFFVFCVVLGIVVLL